MGAGQGDLEWRARRSGSDDSLLRAAAEIAQLLLHDVETADRALLAKEAVRLRKRYQAAKDKLLKMALAEGLDLRR